MIIRSVEEVSFENKHVSKNEDSKGGDPCSKTCFIRQSIWETNGETNGENSNGSNHSPFSLPFVTLNWRLLMQDNVCLYSQTHLMSCLFSLPLSIITFYLYDSRTLWQNTPKLLSYERHMLCCVDLTLLWLFLLFCFVFESKASLRCFSSLLSVPSSVLHSDDTQELLSVETSLTLISFLLSLACHCFIIESSEKLVFSKKRKKIFCCCTERMLILHLSWHEDSSSHRPC